MLLPSAFYVLLRYPAVTKVTTLVKQNYSQKYHRISIFLYLCYALRSDRLTITYCEFFSQILVRKCGLFQIAGQSEQHSLFHRYMLIGTSCNLISIAFIDYQYSNCLMIN